MSTPEEIIDEGFHALEVRMAKARLTATQLVDRSSISYVTYWRCKPRPDDGYAPAKLNSRKKALAALESAMSEYEESVHAG